ncbi:hypothetical protein NFX39_05755 [Fructobacillus sp. W13]|uniref:Uncharacterized protein n=1 Tax=Fructobacillus apis TaxID=2935017 RepID=A0ABT0ZRK0_9LACO|nr:hypothetical protein [Fructobacillus apis]MCO0832583.1 hypothetical protein [Fructobacillus apis]
MKKDRKEHKATAASRQNDDDLFADTLQDDNLKPPCNIEEITLNTASLLQHLLGKELKAKIKLRKRLVYGLIITFSLITMLIFYIVFFLSERVHPEVQKCLIIGLFGNLFGLLMILYRYAFSDTEKIMKSLNALLQQI